MADLGELKIPAATRPAAEAIIALTDQVCPELLDEEYAGLARSVVAKLARKRPSPIQSGGRPLGPAPLSMRWGRLTSCSTPPPSRMRRQMA
jgi:Domain of unknown function (DUF6398)